MNITCSDNEHKIPGFGKIIIIIYLIYNEFDLLALILNFKTIIH
jgi:hypothetical protein